MSINGQKEFELLNKTLIPIYDKYNIKRNGNNSIE